MLRDSDFKRSGNLVMLRDSDFKRIKSIWRSFEMGDMGEYWRDLKPWLKQRSQEKRSSNVAYAHKRLTEEGIEFESKNDGQHLIVQALNARVIDYWPSTGKYIVRGGKSGRGIRGVLKLCGKATKN